ncbi:MAG: Eco57I restriction-modification methylase domain-containing protein [Muribaculaceae bacterium]|nr:Eco57I restriction-modification methylase domain-containing protein [Muribaculaceae bacterium]
MENTLSKIDTTILDNIIVGRVEPYIYAFSTETVPNYLKVGDTSRGVNVRLNEWRKLFPNLTPQYAHTARIDDNTIFRDFAVHRFLEEEKGRTRLQPNTIEGLPYYSREFFKDATAEDVETAISDIIKNARENSGKYPLYSPDHLPQTYTYARTENFAPRDNQQQVIDNFKAAVESGRTNLLLYAVMRFGKSFTSLCCAKKIDARFVVIVSAKADVSAEWKKTVESHEYFEEYLYLESADLKQKEGIIAETLSDTNKKVALFLTLQDLQGSDIKEKHQDVFNRQIDLLIIDETHFGARGESYGKVLQEQRLSKWEINSELKCSDGFETLDCVENAVKSLNTKIRLHLSGTPYRILMSDEFQQEDIIAFVQFTDIIDAQKRWNDKYLKEDDCDEWENPYYGFPQMIRFAFNPNESSRKKMELMRKDGISHAFSELLRPFSMTSNAEGTHRQFHHEAEILDLLEVIDGTKEDENLLGFLDYDKIKQGKMCRHIVCVLPFRASCDALSALIKKNSSRFKNLGNYEIINIAGFDEERKYKSTDDVKRTIKECESRNKKTLTLTVNRMLTGATVPQWDTMLYLKGTASPQEYDQAIFRLQNQYITTFKDESGKIIKYNMKPQTLLVDFDPNRMFILQEMKSQFYNVNVEAQGNTSLRERIAKELAISPIIIRNKDKLQMATPINITDAVREYSRNRSIMDDASDIPFDNGLLNDETMLAVLSTIEPIDSKNGLRIKPVEGEGDNMDTSGNENSAAGEEIEQEENDTSASQPQMPLDEDDKIRKRLAAYYARILFFAFLTDSTVKSLEEVIAAIAETEENRRISYNLGLNVDVVSLVQQKSNAFVLRSLDYKIESVNDLMQDHGLSPIKRVEIAMRKFGRMSDSEIVTPLNVANDMVKMLPKNVFSYGPVLDIASKQGEFTIALLYRFGNAVNDRIYSICTSKLAYEFTRKVYKLLSLPVDHIFESFTSYDIIRKDRDKNYITPHILKTMNFSAIIGNPPYQVNDGSGASYDASNPIYQEFVGISKTLRHQFISIIMPSKWMVGGKVVLKPFRSAMMNDSHISLMVDYENDREIFPNAHNDGGICYFLYDKSYDNDGKLNYIYHPKNGKALNSVRTLKDGDADIIIRDSRRLSLIEKVSSGTKLFKEIVSLTQPYGIRKDLFNSPERYPDARLSETPFAGCVKIYGVKGIKGGAKRTEGYITSATITKNESTVDKYKLFFTTSYSTNAINPPQAILGDKNEICTETFLLVGPFESKLEQLNCKKFFKTNFFKILLFFGRGTMQVSRDVFRFIPMQNFAAGGDIDWSQSIEEIDARLYAKYRLTDEEILFIESTVKSM